MKRESAIACFAWLCISFAVSGAVATDSENSPAALSRSKTLPSRLGYNYFLLEAEIGEEGPLTLLLDTGASHLVLDTKLASRLEARGSVKIVGFEKAISSTGKAVKLKSAEVSDIRLGSYRLARQEAIIADLSMLSRAADARLDGVVGMSLFQDVRLEIDYPAGKIRVEPLDSPVPSGTCRVPVVWRKGLPSVAVEVAGRSVTLELDTGDSEEFSLGSSKRLPLVSRPITVGHAVTAVGPIEDKAARLATNIILAGLVFERPIVRVDQKIPRIGGRVLRHFCVSLDQRNGWCYFKPAISGPVIRGPLRSLGVELAPMEGGFEVVGVLPGTEAARSDLRRGDIVTHIDGEPASQWPKARRHALADDVSEFDVEAVRGNEIRKHKLKVAVLVE